VPLEALSSPAQWAHVLLLCIHRNAEAFRGLASDPGLSGKILQLFLACMVSASPDDNLRGHAWFALSSLVSDGAAGWDWMVLAHAADDGPPGRRRRSCAGPPRRSSLGQASKLCALLRMASGEYKIQLNHRLYGATTTRTNTTVAGAASGGEASSARDRGDRGNVVDGCGRFLALSLDFLARSVDRAEQEEDGEEAEDSSGNEHDNQGVVVAPLSNAAILHVRKSLREALTCTAHFCSELTDFDPTFDLTVIRLFGALLSEFDIFLDRQHDEDDEHNSILVAVRVALRVVRDRDACEGLWPGLLMIFASSEGDESRILILKPYLSDLVGFFEFWWSSTSSFIQNSWSDVNVEVIECSWNVLELWHDMVVRTGVVVQVDEIKRGIVESLSTLLGRASDRQHDGSRIVKAVSSAVWSYLVLQGDEKPNEPDSSIIQHSVELLESAEK
jgi:hypothetical protein